MPPTAYAYPAGSVHPADREGPICWQRWPLDLTASGQQPNESLKTLDSSWRLQMQLLGQIWPGASLLRLQRLARRLILTGGGREQSEDCLNLDIHVPAQGS